MIKYQVSPQEYATKWFTWRMMNGVVGQYADFIFSFTDKNLKAFFEDTYPGINKVWFDNENKVINMINDSE